MNIGLKSEKASRLWRGIRAFSAALPIQSKVLLALLIAIPIAVGSRFLTVSASNQDRPAGSVSADQAKRLCLDEFDHSLGSYELGTLVVAPWSGHANKAFRVAFRYEGRGGTGGYGCTVFRDGRLETNYTD